MKSIILIVFALISIACAFKDCPNWKAWKKAHKKAFKNDVNEEKRFKNFKMRDDRLKAHNEKFRKGEVSFSLQHNEFSDLDDDELKKFFPSLPPIQTFRSLPQVNYYPFIFKTAPASLDYKHHTLPPLNQGSCSACWAFATAAQVEARASFKSRSIIRISPQYLLDCVPNAGCSVGGNAYLSLLYMKVNGYVHYASYPYVIAQQTCNLNVFKVKNTISNFGVTSLDGNEQYLMNMLNHFGPVVVNIFVASPQTFMFSGNGIYYDQNCPSTCETVNHSVLLVGYGVDYTIPFIPRSYWVIKDSYGLIHENNTGYMRIAKGGLYTKNHCNIACAVFYSE